MFDLFLLALFILATRLATFFHELLGHAFMVKAFGGYVEAIRLSLFGGGHVYYHLDPGLGSAARFLVSLGGIMVNLLSGVLAFLLFRRSGKKWEMSLFLTFFGMVSLLGATTYIALGFYYQLGDPVAWLESPSNTGAWLWLPFLVVAPFVSYVVIRAYRILCDHFFPAGSFLERLKILTLTLGVTACAYMGLYGVTGQRSMAIDSPSLSYQRAELEIRKKKMDDLFKQLAQSHPELSEEAIRALVEQTPLILKPGEVPQGFPLKPLIAVLYLAGALLALAVPLEGDAHPPRTISLKSMTLVWAVTGLAIFIITWTGGWIYRST